MHAHGQSMVTPTLRPQDADMQARCSCCWSVRARMLTKRVQLKPWLDQLSSGYIKRASHKGPKQVCAMLAMRTRRRLQFSCMLNGLRRVRGRGGTRRIILRTRSCSARSRLLPTACLCFADAEGGGEAVLQHKHIFPVNRYSVVNSPSRLSPTSYGCNVSGGSRPRGDTARQTVSQPFVVRLLYWGHSAYFCTLCMCEISTGQWSTPL